MNKWLILSVLTALPMTMAADYTSFAFTTPQGQKVIKADGLTITFADGNLVATNVDGTTLLPLSGLSKMEFSNSPTTGIAELGAEQSISVYTPEGIFMGTFANLEAARANLGKGLYILRTADGKTSKTILK